MSNGSPLRTRNASVISNGENRSSDTDGESKSLILDITRHPLSCAICREKYKNPKVRH